MKTTDITLLECMSIIEELATHNECFVDQIPEVLQEDFKNKSLINNKK